MRRGEDSRGRGTRTWAKARACLPWKQAPLNHCCKTASWLSVRARRACLIPLLLSFLFFFWKGKGGTAAAVQLLCWTTQPSPDVSASLGWVKWLLGQEPRGKEATAGLCPGRVGRGGTLNLAAGKPTIAPAVKLALVMICYVHISNSQSSGPFLTPPSFSGTRPPTCLPSPLSRSRVPATYSDF